MGGRDKGCKEDKTKLNVVGVWKKFPLPDQIFFYFLFVSK